VQIVQPLEFGDLLEGQVRILAGVHRDVWH